MYDFVNKCSDLFTFKPIKKLLDWKIYQSFAKTIFKAHYILSTLHIFIPITGRFANFSGTLNLENLLLYLLMFKGCTHWANATLYASIILQTFDASRGSYKLSGSQIIPGNGNLLSGFPVNSEMRYFIKFSYPRPCKFSSPILHQAR